MRALKVVFPIVVLLSALPVIAATFIVPPDRDLIQQATAIVIASPLASWTAANDHDFVRTTTTMSVQEVLKGSVMQQTIEVIEPGGIFDELQTVFPSSPRFKDGERYVLFLVNGDGAWHVLNLVLGKFTFTTNDSGLELLSRDAEEIVGWDAEGRPHFEKPRSRQMFLQYIRDIVAGRPRKTNDFDRPPKSLRIPRTESTMPVVVPSALQVIPNATFSATSYTYMVSGNIGSRWDVFPAPVPFFSVGTEPGAPGVGTTAINAAFAAWNNDPSSNVNYVYSGQDTTGLHTGGINASDSENTILFERDLTQFGIPAFTCTSNSYGGTLGIGGITKASGQHNGPNGEAFLTTLEGDVEMNRGIANCTLLFNNGGLQLRARARGRPHARFPSLGSDPCGRSGYSMQHGPIARVLRERDHESQHPNRAQCRASVVGSAGSRRGLSDDIGGCTRRPDERHRDRSDNDTSRCELDRGGHRNLVPDLPSRSDWHNVHTGRDIDCEFVHGQHRDSKQFLYVQGARDQPCRLD